MRTSTLTVKNETHYQTRDLKKLFNFLLKYYSKQNMNFKFQKVEVAVIYGRKDLSMYAWYGVNPATIQIKLPRNLEKFNRSEKLRKTNAAIGIFDEKFSLENSFEQEIAKRFILGLDYARNLTQKSFIKDFSFLPDTMLVMEKPPYFKPKKTADSQLKKLKENKKRWESKMKRCENALKKINSKIKYYQKKAQL